MPSGNVHLPLQVLCQLIISIVRDFDCGNIVGIESIALPHGYVPFSDIGVAYEIHRDQVTWTEARERCILQGARLAIIDNDKKMNYILKLAPKGIDQLHIGIYRMDDRWIGVGTGLTLSDIPWISTLNYPRPKKGPCGKLELISPIGVWNTDCNGYLYGYVCELSLPYHPIPQENKVPGILVN